MSLTATPQTAAPAPALLVPTARLAAALRRQDARRQLAGGARAWLARDVLGLGAWVTRQSLAARSAGQLPGFALLNQEQAQALWLAVIGADAADDSGRELDLRPAQAEALARLMAEAEETVFAYDLTSAWQAPLPLTLEQSLARRWHREFRERCGALGVGTRTMLLEACAARGIALAPPAARSRGFDAAGPALRALLPPAEAPASAGFDAVHRVYATAEDECDAALEWAQAAREAGGEGGVALVCVDIRSVDLLLARAARWRIARGEAAGGPAELNAPLARTATAPLVEHALLALQTLTPLSPAAAITLLMSPYLGGWRAEFGARARLAAHLQAERVASLSLADVLALVDDAQCPGFAGLLRSLQPLAAHARRRRSMSQWAQFATQWLAAWGWPGGEGLTPQEQAALEAWRRALDTISALDLVLPPQGLADAFARMRQVARGIGAAECMAPDAIDILSPDEAAVLRPAHVWVLGLHDAAWPALPGSNPLLPPALLRQAAVPGSDVAADARHARRLLAHFVGTARDSVLSCALHEGDTPRRPSGALAWPTPVVLSGAPSLFAQWRPEASADLLEDAPPEANVPLPEAQEARGGTGILAAQAACAFRAFAQYRLLAEAVDDAQPGVDPLTRGELVHAAMAELWRALRTQAAAQALGERERDEAIERAIAHALEAMRATHPRLVGRARQLEARRVQRLVAQGLAQDLRRSPFEVVATEQPHELVLGALRIGMRIDRVDRLEDGAELILDYKTGEVSAKEWQLPRPLAPQLLAYALARDAAPLAGIGFAQMKPAKCRLVTLPSKLADGFDEDPRALWRAELGALADDFVAGFANLNPKEGAKTCRRCEFQVLCRVHERPTPVAEDEIDDES